MHRLCGGLFFSFYCVSTSRLRGGSSVHAVSCGHLQHEHGVYLPRRLHGMSCGYLQLQHRRHLQRKLSSVLYWYFQPFWCLRMYMV